MKANIGRVDAFCRITLGLTMIACSTAKLVKKPNNPSSMAGAVIGAMKVAEGVTKFCPLICLMKSQLSQDEKELN